MAGRRLLSIDRVDQAVCRGGAGLQSGGGARGHGTWNRAGRRGPGGAQTEDDLSANCNAQRSDPVALGHWLGETAIDGIERIHAFHRVADRDMVVVVAANWTEVMAPADFLGAGTRTLAFIGSAMILLAAGMVLWELHAIRGKGGRSDLRPKPKRIGAAAGRGRQPNRPSATDMPLG